MVDYKNAISSIAANKIRPKQMIKRRLGGKRMPAKPARGSNSYVDTLRALAKRKQGNL